MRKPKNLTGQRFGSLTVIQMAGKRGQHRNGNHHCVCAVVTAEDTLCADLTICKTATPGIAVYAVVIVGMGLYSWKVVMKIDWFV